MTTIRQSDSGRTLLGAHPSSSHVDSPTGAPILVASDGLAHADPAIFAAKLIAGDGVPVRIVTVLEPLPILSPGVQLPSLAEVEDQRREGRALNLSDQLLRVAGPTTEWPQELRTGDPALEIARAAEEHRARLVVTGLGRHRVLDRVLGDETALHVMRLARTPVLAVPGDFTELPTRIVVATDFSATSTRAATEAIALAADDARVYLVHVVPREVLAASWGEWTADYLRDVERGFERQRQELELPNGVTLDTVMLRGDPAREVLEFALTIGADLIATGTHGHGFISRLLLGSVSTKVVRAAQCAVLAAPHRPLIGATALTVATATPGRMEVHQWTAELDGFTTRNAGRRANLEVDDPEFGAQAQVSEYPFLGASYDRHDARVELMLGEQGYDGRHLSRSIGDVRSIDVLRADDGRDAALRVAHGAGQTLLVFER